MSRFTTSKIRRWSGRVLVLTLLVALPVGWRMITAASTPLPGIATTVKPIPAREGGEFLRGMTVSCPIYGEIWGSANMAESLRELRSIGVEWVAIHPYAAVRRDGSIRYQPAAQTGFLERAVKIAEAEKIQLFWKPHLAYWGSFAWRGDITFDEERGWQRFFDGYQAFIVDQARFAERMGLELFALGVEYEKTTHRPEWLRILAEVRKVYSGRLTNAANWDALERVPFWSELDLIGVQAYFPLSDQEQPDRETLWRAWEQHLEQLRKLSDRHGKHILLAEIGYDLSPLASREPWRTHSRENAATRALRQRLISVALERLEREPRIAGMFWWKWMPGRSLKARDFPMRHPDAIATLRRAWAGE